MYPNSKCALTVRPTLEPLEDRIVPIASSLRVVAPGPGAPPRIQVFDTQTQTQIADFNVFNPAFTGGVSVGVGDFNGDLVDDVIVGAGPGGGPHVRVFEGIGNPGGPVTILNQATPIVDFFAYEATFRGGVNVAMGDVDPGNNNPGVTVRDEIIVGAGAGRPGGSVRIFRNNNIIAGTNFVVFNATPITDLMPYAPAFTGSVNVASADLDGPLSVFANSQAFELIVGAGAGGGPHVRVFRGVFGQFNDLQNFNVNTLLADFFAYDPAFRGGVSVGAGPLGNADGVPVVFTGAGLGGGPHVRTFVPNLEGGSGAALPFGALNVGVDFFAFDPNFRGGVNVGFEPTTVGLLAAQGPNPLGPSLFTAFALDFNGALVTVTPPTAFSIFNNGLFVSH